MSYRTLFLIGAIAGAGWQLAQYMGYFGAAPRAGESAPAAETNPEASAPASQASPRTPSSAPASRSREPAASGPATPGEVTTETSNWKIERALDEEYPRRITGLDLRYPRARDNLWEASQEFIERYAENLFRVDRAQLKVSYVRPLGTNEYMKIVYEQEIDGVPVLNSRFAMFFLGDGTVFEVQANVLTADTSVPKAPSLSAGESAVLASRAIALHYQAQNVAMPASLSPEKLAGSGKYAIYLSDSGKVSGVYQYIVLLAGLTGPNAGEHEILVDTGLGQVASDRKISRN